MACLIYHDDQGNSTRFPLGKATLMLGSAEESQILLDDTTVSRNHASIIFDKDKFWVRDNGSTNGSIINGTQVQHQELNNGDILQFGSYKFFFDEFYQTSSQLEKTVSKDVQLLNPVASQRKGQDYRQTVQLKSAARYSRGSVQMLLTEGLQHHPDGLCNTSKICGFLGFIAFIPAIITGHMAIPKSAIDKKNQAIGLALGYSFLFLWLIVGLYFWNNPIRTTPSGTAASTSVVAPLPLNTVYPLLSNPLELLKIPMVWLPPKGIYKHILFNEINPAIESNANLQREVASIKSVFLHGLVWMELGTASFKLDATLRKLSLIYETYRTNPTFWEYNSSMVPEKKTYYDPFFFSESTPQFFYEKDLSMNPPITRFSEPQFRWCFGVRGLRFDLPANFNPQESIANLRVILVLRAADTQTTLNVETLEGNLTRDEEKAYEYKITPATLFAAIVYRVTDRKPVILSTYEKYFSIDDTKNLQTWLDKNLNEVIANQPNSALSIAAPFTIQEKVVVPPKPKVSFMIEPVKP